VWHSLRVFVQINPAVPLVWRDHSTAQAGIDPVLVRFDDVDDVTARALAELVKGTSTSRLTALLGARRSAELQARCGPALRAAPPPQLPRVAVIGKHPQSALIAAVLSGASSGVVCCVSTNVVDVSRIDLAVLVSNFVISPMDSQPWLAHDIPHVPIVFTESGAHIGPVVRPGVTACLACVELSRIDVDPAWSAIAPQVWGRAVTVDAALATHAAATALTILGASAGRVVHLSGLTFASRSSTSSLHPRCGCQSLPAQPE
jgi:hypothetical protein